MLTFAEQKEIERVFENAAQKNKMNDMAVSTYLDDAFDVATGDIFKVYYFNLYQYNWIVIAWEDGDISVPMRVEG